ncbi:MAG: hypothetical protein ACR2QW_04635 [bacterium]
MIAERLFKYALCALVPLLGIIIVREIPIAYSSADYYYYERIFFDFFQQGSTWSDMYFGPAPGFFTNMLPVWIISLFIDHLSRIFLFHICLYGMITMAVIWFISRSVAEDYLPSVLAVFMAILLIIAVGSENSFWNRPSHHYGSFINLMLAMYLMVVGINSWKAKLFIYLIVILTVVSDFLFIPVYLAMTGGFLLVYWLSGEAALKASVLRGVLLVAPVVLGIALHYLITPNVVANPVWASGLSLREVLTSISVHIGAAKFLFVEGVRLPVYWLSLVLGVLAWFSIRDQGPLAKRFLYYLVAMQCVIWGNIYVSGLADSLVVRYRLFAINGACVLVAISFAILAFKTRKKELLPWLMLVSTFALGLGYLLSPDQERIEYVNAQDARYLRLIDQVECVRNVVEDNGLKSGISGYKEANPYTVLSGGEVFLYPVKGKSAKPLNWLVSGIGLQRKYNYALVTAGITESYYKISRAYYRLGRIVVEKAYGAPLKSASCGNMEVLIYPEIPFGRTAGG